MIEKEGKKLILECDSCSSYVEDFFDFQIAFVPLAFPSLGTLSV